MSGFLNKPKILRGAFVEYGLSIPPLFVVFQFNPVQLTRNRSLTYSASSSAQTKGQRESLRDFHKRYDDLNKLRDEQHVCRNLYRPVRQPPRYSTRVDLGTRLEQRLP
jgi:hypothetical protein